MLDSVIQHETPEGAILRLRPAGAPVRALAWVIDVAIRALIIIVLGIVLSLFGELGIGFYLVVIFMLDWFYNVFFEVLKGATPGKKRLGLVVVNDNGTPVTWSASLLRNLLRVVDFLPVGYALGLVWTLFHPQYKRLGDLAAGTRVIYEEARVQTNLPEQLEQVKAIRPPVPLDYATQQAILDFAERSTWLAPARQIELAELLKPLHGKQGEDSVQLLLGYAKQIAGQA
jgi:uncharacterized RDD family membrane protein YckC